MAMKNDDGDAVEGLHSNCFWLSGCCFCKFSSPTPQVVVIIAIVIIIILTSEPTRNGLHFT